MSARRALALLNSPQVYNPLFFIGNEDKILTEKYCTNTVEKFIIHNDTFFIKRTKKSFKF